MGIKELGFVTKIISFKIGKGDKISFVFLLKISEFPQALHFGKHT